MPENSFDVIVVGGGPGGYVAALRCAQWGMKTALIERAQVGGTCLNRGCIPAKALLHSTGLLRELRLHGKANGLAMDLPTPDLAAIHANKDTTVQKLRGGVELLLQKRGVTILKGEATPLESKDSPAVELKGGEESQPQILKTTHLIWATGARPAELPALPFDGTRVISSDEALRLEKTPTSLAIVGAGAIGLEMGSIWARLGTKVTIVEALPQIGAGFDPDIASMAERFLKRQEGITFYTDARVKAMDETALIAEQKGKDLRIDAEKILISVGRVPNNEPLIKIGAKADEKGRLEVDEAYRTNLPGVYAIGDAIPGPALAHRAEHDAERLAAMLAKKPVPPANAPMPGVVYTTPELAMVGLSEAQAQAQGVDFSAAKFPFAANGRALTNGTPEGFVKLIGDKTSGKLLGAQILGANAGELISTIGAHLKHNAKISDLAHTLTAHPTLSEAIKEAALVWEGNPLHTV